VILDSNQGYLEFLLPKIQNFLANKLKLKIHSKKLLIKTMSSGMDFLGWVHFPDYRILRTTTKRRMLKRLMINQSDETINSYLGLIKHGNTNKLKKKIFDLINKNPQP